MASSSSSSTQFHTLIIALKGEKYALMCADSLGTFGVLNWVDGTDFDKTIKAYENIRCGVSGNLGCCEEIRQSLKEFSWPDDITSVNHVASLIKDLINRNHFQGWKEDKGDIDMLVVGNIVGEDDFHIFRIRPTDGTYNTEYGLVEITEPLIAMGSGIEVPEVHELLGMFNPNDDFRKATALALNTLSTAVLKKVTVGGNMRLLTFFRDVVTEDVLEQDKPSDCTSKYTVRTHTVTDTFDSTEFSVTYRTNN